MKYLIIPSFIIILLATLVIGLTVPSTIKPGGENKVELPKAADILIISINYNNGALTLSSLQTTQGFSSKRNDVSKGDYLLELVDDSGNVLSKRFFNKPLVIYEFKENDRLTGVLNTPSKTEITLNINLDKNAKQLRAKNTKTNKIILRENLDWLKYI